MRRGSRLGCPGCSAAGPPARRRASTFGTLLDSDRGSGLRCDATAGRSSANLVEASFEILSRSSRWSLTRPQRDSLDPRCQELAPRRCGDRPCLGGHVKSGFARPPRIQDDTYVVRTRSGGEGYVVAASVSHKEWTGTHSEPSPLIPKLPPG